MMEDRNVLENNTISTSSCFWILVLYISAIKNSGCLVKSQNACLLQINSNVQKSIPFFLFIKIQWPRKREAISWRGRREKRGRKK